MRQACVVCQEPVSDEGIFATREMMLGTRDAFHYFSCTDCGSLTLVDPPSDWTRYYPLDSYYSIGESSVLYAPSWRRRRKTDVFLRAPRRLVSLTSRRSKTRRLSTPVWYPWFHALRLSRSSRFLDVGSGTGVLLHKLAADGFRWLVGVDPFIEAPLAYPDGVRIVKGEIGDVSGKFDMVMFHHSLEHMAGPAEQLAAAAAVLSASGAILVRIPVADSWAFRHYGSDWVQLDPPRHQIILTDRAMERVADQCGLSLQRTYRDSAAFQMWGSELYRRNARLLDARPSDHFSSVELEAFQRQADDLNGCADGDQGVYILRPNSATRGSSHAGGSRAASPRCS